MRVCDICQASATASMELTTPVDRTIYTETHDLCETHYQMVREMVAGQALGQAVMDKPEKRPPGRPKKNE
uniref:Uncharacterized protein n=1 Tax=viral metagenome TaxID=1070528 RepID=A0A6M3IJT7_9ZZZZ